MQFNLVDFSPIYFDSRSKILFSASASISVALCCLALYRQQVKPGLGGVLLFSFGTAAAVGLTKEVCLPPGVGELVGEMPWETSQPLARSAKSIGYSKEEVGRRLEGRAGEVAAASERAPIAAIDPLEGLSFVEINKRIRDLNRSRLQLWRKLAPQLRSANSWKGSEVRTQFEAIVKITAKQVETTIRFYEFRFSTDQAIGKAIEDQDLLGHFTLFGIMHQTFAVARDQLYHSTPFDTKWSGAARGSSVESREIWQRHCDRLRLYLAHMSEANRPRYEALLRL